MFGLLHSEFVQSSAIRTWNCVAHIANLLWYKFHHLRDPIMPRSRRRHHSRSRSRSRSHSHERDREPKRRKIDETHRRTVSSQPEATNDHENQTETLDEVRDFTNDYDFQKEKQDNEIASDNAVLSDNSDDVDDSEKEKSEDSNENEKQLDISYDDDCEKDAFTNYDCKVVLVDVGGGYAIPKNDAVSNVQNDESIEVDSDDDDTDDEQSESKSPSKSQTKSNDLEITPKKSGSSKQPQKRLDSEKKRIEKEKEKEERQMKRQKEKEEREIKKQKEKEEKNRAKEEKLKQKQEKDEQKLKEKMEKQEQKQREKEMKELKRREKEEKDEQKRKEKEQEKLKRQQDIDEKNREKAKIEEQKQKAAAVFVNFFLTKKTDASEEKIQRREEKFMPFEIKSEMRLAPVLRRAEFTEENKSALDETLQNQDCNTLYLDELKHGKSTSKMKKTWPMEDSVEDDVLVIEENTLGETIVEQKPKLEKMRAKFLKFHENQRPPYFGTWRKRSKFVRPRNPFGRDVTVFDYEVDSDDEWEDEDEGESLKGSDEDEKENDSENEYEVDNEFFVPHGHLSDDEVDDEQNAKLSPESHKAKLKLLKNEFEEEMKSKTQKIKPRVIGCIWYNKTQDNIEDAIHRYLQPFSIISNGQVQIVKRSNIISSAQKKVTAKRLEREYIPLFLKLIHGNVKKRKILVNEFLEFLSNNGVQVDVSKIALSRQFKELAQWMKCPEQGVMHNKLCWYVNEDVRKEFNVNVSLPNAWKSVSKMDTALE